MPNLGGHDIPGLIFADDIILTTTTPVGMQRGLDKIVQFSEKWGLKVNQSKTKVMVCKKGAKLGKSEKWNIKGEKLRWLIK